jgi:hypothetical protein
MKGVNTMYKIFAYLNGLKDGILVLLVPLSLLVGAIIMVMSFLGFPEMRESLIDMANNFEIGSNNQTDNEKKEETKVKMGFNLD